MLPQILFGGFYANAAHFPGWVMWLQYFSTIRYTVESLTRNEFRDGN
jgi:hypothetical protein